MSDPSVSPADTPAWEYADVLAGPWYVFREPRDEHRLAIKSGPFTILTVSDYFDGGGPLEERLEWLCRIVNERLVLEGVSATSDRWHGLYAGTANDQAMVNREALAALLDERDVLLAVGERDKAELSGLRVEFGEWVKAIHEAFAEREVDPQSDGPGRIRRLVLERQQAEERGERDRRQIAQLIEALREARPIVASVAYEFDAPADSKVLEQIDAVLADEEDAANG